MSCSNTTNTAPVTIIQGEDRLLTIKLVQASSADACGSFSLSGATEIVAKFLKEDDSILEKKLSLSEIAVIDAPAGKFSVTLTDADTALLKEGNNQSFTVVIDIGASRRIVNFKEALSVEVAAIA